MYIFVTVYIFTDTNSAYITTGTHKNNGFTFYTHRSVTLAEGLSYIARHNLQIAQTGVCGLFEGTKQKFIH